MKLYTATDGKVFTNGYDRDEYNDLLKGNHKKAISLAFELFFKGELSLLRLIKTLCSISKKMIGTSN